MRTVIIDDDKRSCLNLMQKLTDDYGVTVEGYAHNGFDGLELINRTRPDTVFLDVELPDISGLDFISRSSYLSESGCRIVMYTAYDKYVLPALRRRAFDVLLKPVDDADLKVVMARLMSEKQAVAAPQSAEKKDQRYVLFTNSIDFTIISRGDIGLFQYNSPVRCWEAVVTGIDKPVRLRRNICSENIIMLGNQYVQVHQKYIINADYLLDVVDNCCHFFPPFDKIDYVIVGRVYRRKLLERFNIL